MNKGEFDATAILSVKAKQEIIEKTNVSKLKKKICAKGIHRMLL